MIIVLLCKYSNVPMHCYLFVYIYIYTCGKINIIIEKHDYICTDISQLNIQMMKTVYNLLFFSTLVELIL